MEINIHTQINQVFAPVFTTDKQIIDLVGGRGRGASFFATQYFLLKIISAQYFRGVFLRRIFNDVRNSLFQDFKDRIEENGLSRFFKINSNEMTFVYIPNGNKIISKGAVKNSDRSANLKSLAGFTDILIEEANEIDEEDFNTLLVSIRTTKTQVMRLFNPPHIEHWIWRSYNITEEKISVGDKEEIYWKYFPKSETDIEMVFSTYHNNIHNINPKSVAMYEKYKTRNPEYYYNQIMGLIPSGAKGRVYDGWQSITYKQFNKIECRAVYVIDFGYSPDPTAVIQVKWKNNDIYIHELIYETELDDLSLAKRLSDLGVTYRDLIIADYGNGGTLRIITFRTGGSGTWKGIKEYPGLAKGFSMVQAKKAAGSIKSGIKMVQGTNVFMTETSANGWTEYRKYTWAADRFGSSIGTPVDKYNHIMDCIRYFIQYRAVYSL